MKEDEEEDIVEQEMWDHYSELPNPMWYEYKRKQMEKEITDKETSS